MNSETFENSFAPSLQNKFLNVEQILVGLRMGAVIPERLPPEVQKAIQNEIDRRVKEQMTPMMMLLLVVGTMGEVKHRLRLQKYAFLADQQLLKQRKGRKGGKLVYGWIPEKYGPFSKVLEYCVAEAIEENLVDQFVISKADQHPDFGYRLTIRGTTEFHRILWNFKTMSGLVSDLLQPFQHDTTESRLLELVHQQYPEYVADRLIQDKFLDTKRDK